MTAAGTPPSQVDLVKALAPRQAGKLTTGAILFGSASKFSRWPRQRAGLSPMKYLLTVVQSRMDSMRPRRRTAVSVLTFQIGRSTFMTKSVSTSETGSAPNTGDA